MDEENHMTDEQIRQVGTSIPPVALAKVDVPDSDHEEVQQDLALRRNECKKVKVLYIPNEDITWAKEQLLQRWNAWIICKKGENHDWCLLCVLPKIQCTVVLDSASGMYIKPTHQRAVSKMWRILLVADGKLSLHDWSFNENSPNDMQQQDNDYDYYIFVCMFAELLLFLVPLS